MTTPEKRKVLSRRQVLQLMLDQDGKCGCGCGEKLQPMTEGVIDEHVRALGLLGGNELENRSLWRKPCSKAKTDGEDLPRIAKAKRQARCVGPREPPKNPIPQRVNPWPARGSVKIQSRGFQKRFQP